MLRRAPIAFAGCVALALSAGSLACGSGPDPSKGGAVMGVQVDPSDNNGNAYVQGIALGSNALYAAFGGSLVRFGFDGSAPQTGVFNQNSSAFEVAVDASDGSVWWAGGSGMGGMGCTSGSPLGLWTSTDATFLTITSATTPAALACSINSNTGSPTVYGLVADDAWVIMAVASGSQSMSGSSSVPDQQGWPGQQPTLAPGLSASLQRFDRKNPSASLVSLAGVSSLATALTSHVLAQSTHEVYWLDASDTASDRVMRASKSSWSTGQMVATAKANTLTGIAANDAYVAWATSSSPKPGASGCSVFASHADGPPMAVYDGTSAPFLCWGLAVDDAYAYFATTTVVQPPSNDPGASPYMMGTGIGRVPLAGGPIQTVPLASSRWYGARRVLADAKYVYAVDPSFVVRVDKSAFGE